MIMKELGFGIDTHDGKKTFSYHEIFDGMRPDDYLDLAMRMRRILEKTNLPLFFESCLRLKPEFQGRV